MNSSIPLSDGTVPRELLSTEDRLVFFPVRHHSPACAKLLREFILQTQPAAVLIEGPSDFNDRLDELRLPHQLPIAIYSYVHLNNGLRRGAFYPFCEYSPEWQAIVASAMVGSVARFIDLPWADLATANSEQLNRYSDAELRYGRYVKIVCERLGVEDFDAAWDVMIEQHPDLTLVEYFERCHHYCCQTRAMQGEVSPSDDRREACMARYVRMAMEEFPTGRIVIVTGGFHSLAVMQRLQDSHEDQSIASEYEGNVVDRGIAITPYSFERLDSLRGYDAGLPNPGFYDQVWSDRQSSRGLSYRRLLSKVVERLRKRGQTCSTADFIAVESMARGLARLRGRREVWRNDLVDAITSALIKEEVDDRHRSPFLAAVFDVLRGDKRGQLAAGAQLPPLTRDIKRQLQQFGLEPSTTFRDESLELTVPEQLEKSRLLHCLRLLRIDGFERIDGTDLATRSDLSRWFETWKLQWHPEFEVACIEAARYGSSLREGVDARLLERAQAMDRNAAEAALLLLDAALAGSQLPAPLVAELDQLIGSDNQFLSVTGALEHLFFLYRYDEVLGTAGTTTLGELLSTTFARGVWLLEQLGQVAGQERSMLGGMQALAEAFERLESGLQLDREEFVDVLSRVQADDQQSAIMRGASAGVLARLGAVSAERLRSDLHLFTEPSQMGDYLTGVFALARELAQREPQLVLSVDDLLMGWSADEFINALPSFRLAFTYFTPREKHHMLTTLFKTLGIANTAPLAKLEVAPELAAQAMALESRVYAMIERFGLRGGPT